MLGERSAPQHASRPQLSAEALRETIARAFQLGQQELAMASGNGVIVPVLMGTCT